MRSGAATRVLQAIFDEYGDIKPSVLVETAADESCEIHDKFPWDDAYAANEHRLDIARKMIRVTPIEYEGRMQTVMHIPVVHLAGSGGRPGEGSYKPISCIIKSQSEYERCLAELVAQSVGLNRAINLLTEAAKNEGVELVVSSDMMKLSRAAARVEGLIKTISMQ